MNRFLNKLLNIAVLWLMAFTLHAAQLSTRYSYDEAGNKTSQTDALGHVTQWTYSVLNQITSRTLPDGSRESFSYDSTGQLISHTDFNNQTTRYGYDALNRLIFTQYPDGRSVKNTYNTNQQLDTVTESQTVNGKVVNQTTKYNYDINDRLVKVTYPNNQSISYSYDAVGNLLTRSTVNGTTKYSYDLNDRLATVTDSQGGLTRFSYDAVGNKTERVLANGIKTSWQYNSRNQLIGLSHRQADGTLIAEYQYTLDAKGNRTAITETLVNEQGQSHQRQLAYSYDNVDRLISETVTDNDNAFGGSYSRSYQYDSVGNRSQQSHTANNQTITTTYSYDVNDQLQSETTGGVQTNYRYDKNGNLIEKYNAVGIIAQYRYNTQNQLTEVILPQVSYRYAYDSQGNRIQSQQLKNGQTDTTQYLVDTNFNYAEVIEEKDGQGQLLASQTFTPENTGDLLSITNASKESRYTLEDGLGSLRQITNTLGQVQGSQTTTAWGENLNNTTKTYTDYGYTGEKQNTETGLVYLRAREYMPSVGRFVQRDKHSGSMTQPITLNKQIYANANPVKYTDPTGNFGLAEASVANSIANVLQDIQITTGTSLLDAALYPDSAAQGVLYSGLALGVGIIGSVELAKLLSKKYLQQYLQKCNSFDGDTLVWTKDGKKRIQDILIGELVLGYDEATKEIGYYPVTNWIQNYKEQPWTTLKTENGEVIHATAGHPFYVSNSLTNYEWLNADQLKQGSLVFSDKDKKISLYDAKTAIENKHSYNLTVDKAHTYFVGKDKLLSHNNNCVSSYNIDLSVTLYAKKNVNGIRGGHHQPLAKGYNISNKQDFFGGFYKADLTLPSGQTKTGVSFFPDEYSEVKVVGLMQKAALVLLKGEANGKGKVDLGDLDPSFPKGKVLLDFKVENGTIMHGYPLIVTW